MYTLRRLAKFSIDSSKSASTPQLVIMPLAAWFTGMLIGYQYMKWRMTHTSSRTPTPACIAFAGWDDVWKQKKNSQRRETRHQRLLTHKASSVSEGGGVRKWGQYRYSSLDRFHQSIPCSNITESLCSALEKRGNIVDRLATLEINEK